MHGLSLRPESRDIGLALSGTPDTCQAAGHYTKSGGDWQSEWHTGKQGAALFRHRPSGRSRAGIATHGGRPHGTVRACTGSSRPVDRCHRILMQRGQNRSPRAASAGFWRPSAGAASSRAGVQYARTALVWIGTLSWKTGIVTIGIAAVHDRWPTPGGLGCPDRRPGSRARAFLQELCFMQAHGSVQASSCLGRWGSAETHSTWSEMPRSREKACDRMAVSPVAQA